VSEKGSPEDALQLFEKALSIDPHHSASLLASARLIQDQAISRDYSLAMQRLSTLIELGHEDEHVYFNLAMLAIKNEAHFGKAKYFLSHAIRIKSNFSEALYNMALLLYNEKSPQAILAIEYLTKLLSSNSQHIKGLLLLGDIYIEYFNDLKNGENCYKRILSIDSSNIFAQHNLCVILVRKQNFVDAINCFEKIQSHIESNNNSRKHISSVVNVEQHLKITRDLLRDQLRNRSQNGVKLRI